MASSGFMRSLIIAVCFAVSFVATLPERIIDAAGRFIFNFTDGVIVRHIRDLLRGPALAYDGPSDSAIEPSLMHRQRHEAGLSRLGTVRHIS